MAPIINGSETPRLVVVISCAGLVSGVIDVALEVMLLRYSIHLADSVFLFSTAFQWRNSIITGRNSCFFSMKAPTSPLAKYCLYKCSFDHRLSFLCLESASCSIGYCWLLSVRLLVLFECILVVQLSSFCLDIVDISHRRAGVPLHSWDAVSVTLALLRGPK